MIDISQCQDNATGTLTC